METNDLGATPEQQAPAPAQAAQQQSRDWEATAKGLQRSLQSKVDEYGTLRTQYDSVEQSLKAATQQLTSISGERDTALSQYNDLNSQFSQVNQKLARYEAFAAVPELAHLMNNPAINPTGETPEERVASLKSLAALLGQNQQAAAAQVEAQVAEQVRDAQNNLSPNVKAQPQLTPEQQVEQLRDKAYELIKQGDPSWQNVWDDVLELEMTGVLQREASR